MLCGNEGVSLSTPAFSTGARRRLLKQSKARKWHLCGEPRVKFTLSPPAHPSNPSHPVLLCPALPTLPPFPAACFPPRQSRGGAALCDNYVPNIVG